MWSESIVFPLWVPPVQVQAPTQRYNQKMFNRRSKAPINDEDRAVPDPERSRQRTMDRAVRLLAAKPRSVRELRDRLMEKSWTNSEIVDSVIAKLAAYKYLDDEQFARDAALAKLRERPQGKRRLQMTMSQKKLEKGTVDRAIKEAFDAMPESELINAAISKRLRLKGKPETREDMKKFVDHLLRRGFSYDLIRDSMAAISDGRFDDEG